MAIKFRLPVKLLDIGIYRGNINTFLYCCVVNKLRRHKYMTVLKDKNSDFVKYYKGIQLFCIDYIIEPRCTSTVYVLTILLNRDVQVPYTY